MVEMVLYEELQHIVDTLNKSGVPFALCGGIAVGLHGYVRGTDDIDLIILAKDIDRAKAALDIVGFSLPALPMTFDRGTDRERVVHRVSKIADGDHLILDLIIASGALNEVWADRQLLDWQGRIIGVVSRTGLERMKRLAGRDQDLMDLKYLGMDPGATNE